MEEGDSGLPSSYQLAQGSLTGHSPNPRPEKKLKQKPLCNALPVCTSSPGRGMCDTAQLPVPTSLLLHKTRSWEGRFPYSGHQACFLIYGKGSCSNFQNAYLSPSNLYLTAGLKILFPTSKTNMNCLPACRAAVIASRETEMALCLHPRSPERSAD